MLNIKIEGLDDLTRKLDSMSRQVPFATARAITQTAKSVENKLQASMAGAFKSPSPYVKRSTFATVATKVNLSSTVGIKDQKPSGGTAPAVLLKEHFSGGVRGNKPFEKALLSLGAMPQGYRAMPGKGMKLDAYGNPNRREIGEMLGSLRTRMQMYKGRGKNTVLVGFFVVPVGATSKLHPGVYKRVARGALLTMFIFVKQASYHKVLDFMRDAQEVVAAEFQPNFDKAFEDAMRAAR